MGRWTVEAEAGRAIREVVAVLSPGFEVDGARGVWVADRVRHGMEETLVAGPLDDERCVLTSAVTPSGMGRTAFALLGGPIAAGVLALVGLAWGGAGWWSLAGAVGAWVFAWWLAVATFRRWLTSDRHPEQQLARAVGIAVERAGLVATADADAPPASIEEVGGELFLLHSYLCQAEGMTFVRPGLELAEEKAAALSLHPDSRSWTRIAALRRRLEHDPNEEVLRRARARARASSETR